jgi:flagellar biosynthesis protein FliR
MNAFAISLALKVLMGLLAMLLGFPYLWPQILQEVDRVGQQMVMLFR